MLLQNGKYLAELTPYDELVLAMKKHIDTGENTICHMGFQVNGRDYYPSSVIVCDTPQLLKDMNCPGDIVIFNLSHFETGMKKVIDEYLRDHSHEQTTNDFKRLPEMIAHPLMILTESKQRDSAGYKPIVLLYADENERDKEGQQAFHKVVIQPDDYYNGLFHRCRAVQVLSFYPLELKNLDKIMSDIANGDRDLLYFDKERYDRVKYMKKYDMSAYDGFRRVKSLDGYYESDVRDSEKSKFQARFEFNVTSCADTELQRCIFNALSYKDSGFEPVKYAMRVFSNKESSFEEIADAARLIIMSADMLGKSYRDKVLKKLRSEILPEIIPNAIKSRFELLEKEQSSILEIVGAAAEIKRAQDDIGGPFFDEQIAVIGKEKIPTLIADRFAEFNRDIHYMNDVSLIGQFRLTVEPATTLISAAKQELGDAFFGETFERIRDDILPVLINDRLSKYLEDTNWHILGADEFIDSMYSFADNMIFNGDDLFSTAKQVISSKLFDVETEIYEQEGREWE